MSNMWMKIEEEIGNAQNGHGQLPVRTSMRKIKYPNLTKREDQSSASQLMLAGTTMGPVKATTSIPDISSWLVTGAGVLE
jgi:hypothetical protein